MPTVKLLSGKSNNKVKTPSKMNFFMLVLGVVFPKEIFGKRTLK